MELHAAAKAALERSDPATKCRAVAEGWRAIEAGAARFDADGPVEPIGAPGRPAHPRRVPPMDVPRRRLGNVEGRAALVHAIAHIEFNAINLALDAAYRFRGLPPEFTLDWWSVAADEARHFELLTRRLEELGHAYGDFPAHNGLWEMAEKTAGDVMVRMALVPRVLEARGLDVTPGMIERLRGVGDERTVAALEVILAEEVRHVEIGTRWFHHCCRERGVEPGATFLSLLEAHYGGLPRGPFNLEARRRAGFSAAELEALDAAAA